MGGLGSRPVILKRCSAGTAGQPGLMLSGMLCAACGIFLFLAVLFTFSRCSPPPQLPLAQDTAEEAGKTSFHRVVVVCNQPRLQNAQLPKSFLLGLSPWKC